MKFKKAQIPASLFSSLLIATLLLVFCLHSNAQETTQIAFPSLDSVFSYTQHKSTTLHSGEIKFSQAQKAKLAAIASIIDLNANISLNITDNTKLPVSYFPAEAFGGTPGTYREIQTGIPYTNNFNQYADIKLLNVSGWQNLKLAKINIESTTTDNKLSQKSLYENIAATYYNILTLQEQLKSTNKNVATADTLHQMVKTKFDAGMSRQQDVNDAEVNFLNTKESASQIQFLIQQQYIAIKILCDIPDATAITIQENIAFNKSTTPTIQLNNLNTTNSLLKEKYAFNNYRQLKFTILPIISAFASNSNQQYSNNFSLVDKNVNWINSNYIGLKAVWQIPSANTVSQISKAKYDSQLAKENSEHSKLKSQLDFSQLNIDYEKAVSQFSTNEHTTLLQNDSYKKNLENYQQGIINLSQLLTSYNAMVNSNYNYISSAVSVMLMQSKIKINNNIQ
ncbi:MAG: Outer membrane protein [Bacteroidetes bacterium]|nr:MAG: Outer membrane protein [Bacteroidota bacterium]